ncbi:GAF domain-containing protein [Kordiimonas aestuarii]|uniref:GAF domain-containing protein n=1 Tax=Kordiimonas aestuarii TaxID=1005925 RepID=UPI0021D1DA46|nr:GAF domain-containing protein [Kordiimonas aestuarii]
MSKSEIYETVVAQIEAVLEGENDCIAQMATISCLLSEAFPERYFWTGFYIVDDAKQDELVVGPYQGTLGCLRIAFGKGVCGMAAATRQTQVVEDVHAIANHIACDSRSNSEIVVPVVDEDGELVAVFDVDSTDFAAFDDVDKTYLERLMASVFAR